MIILTFMRIMGGRALRWLIFPYFSIIVLPFYLKYLVLIVCIVGGIGSYFLYRIFILFYSKYLNFINLIKMFVLIIWFIPILTVLKNNRFYLSKGENCLKILNFGWREIFIGYYMFQSIENFSTYLIKFQFTQLTYILNFYFIIVLLVFIIY